MICPFCSEENIDGADECLACGQPLDFLTKPTPTNDVEARLFQDRIQILSPRKPFVVSPETPVGEVVKKIVERRFGCAVIVEADQVVGIFSERDALLKLNVDAAALAARPVSEFMTPAPETLEAHDRIAYAIHKMDVGGYRHIPILKDGVPSGVISVRDILRYLTEDLHAA